MASDSDTAANSGKATDCTVVGGPAADRMAAGGKAAGGTAAGGGSGGGMAADDTSADDTAAWRSLAGASAGACLGTTPTSRPVWHFSPSPPWRAHGRSRGRLRPRLTGHGRSRGRLRPCPLLAGSGSAGQAAAGAQGR
jgi:hypothetical protein